MRIEAEQVGYTYMSGSPFEKEALRDVSLVLSSGKYHAVAGHTGSGKSTLLQLFNGLEKPTKGKLTVGDWTITPETKQRDLYELRRYAGIVFQFPEQQLFDETIVKDVMYGPLNLGVNKEKAEQLAKDTLLRVGIGEELHGRSPFELSGGQMRRTAIAGVLAMEPELLLLDEPTAGLDPKGQKEIMELFYDWFKEKPERTIVLISHDMNQVARYADHVVVMGDGKKQLEKTPAELFTDETMLQTYQLAMPETVRILKALETASGRPVASDAFTREETLQRILAWKRGERSG
ncbi:MAG: energy-coupling factor transporter ATPase [Alkalicoccus sp.]|nr:MAG: energy-coupling factor transporter ATPase [Alkalicoccus sp.]